MQNLWSVGGTVVAWDVDQGVIQQHVRWAQRGNLLERELQRLQEPDCAERFATFVLTLAHRDHILTEIYCPNCKSILGFKDSDFRCANPACNVSVNPRAGSRLCLTGRLRSLVGNIQDGHFVGRPSVKKLFEKGLSSKWFVVVNGEVYFAPRIYGLFSDDWDSAQPAILIEKDYFKAIGLRGSLYDYHAYEKDFKGLLWLCIYANWRPTRMADVINFRIVPKIIIDLQIADLVAVGKLNRVLDELGIDVHQLYNVVGRTHAEPSKSVRYAELYQEFVQTD